MPSTIFRMIEALNQGENAWIAALMKDTGLTRFRPGQALKMTNLPASMRFLFWSTYLNGCYFLRECHRTLKPGGKLILLTPNISTYFTAIKWCSLPKNKPGPIISPTFFALQSLSSFGSSYLF